jgi:hypothetical protein
MTQQSKSVFSLGGNDENSATRALAWCLQRSRQLQNVFYKDIFQSEKKDSERCEVKTQTHGSDGGFTDIEILFPGDKWVIVEAKVGWQLPSTEQLSRYAPRFSHLNADQKLFLTISAMDREAAHRQSPNPMHGISTIHRSWLDIIRLTKAARTNTRLFEERLWLSNLVEHLNGYNEMRDANSNQAFCVSLSAKPIRNGESLSWIDVVTNLGVYFHPIRKKWPKQPPNYIAFRYRGELQSVHHVDSFEVAPSLVKIDKRFPDVEEDHFFYKLGPAMKPATKLKNGSIFGNAIFFVAIDTLLSGAYTTVSDALAASNRRRD